MSGLTPKLPLTRDTLNGYMLITEYKNLVKQNFKNLMLTIPGERVMNLDFGIGLKRFLFEMDNPGVYDKISGRIVEQVTKYLPYINIVDIKFNSAANDETLDPHFLGIAIEYIIVPLNTSDKLEVTLPDD
jgi:phage baseplate assembly protein W